MCYIKPTTNTHLLERTNLTRFSLSLTHTFLKHMDQEENLKIFDLKVSVNCCEGCKRKVLKALSIKGVLKVQIHPSLPKVTVTGNTHAQILIKKLAKIGKIAQIWPQEMLSSSSSFKTIRVDQETSLSKAIEDQVIIKNCKGNPSSEEANHQSKKHDCSVGERSSKQACELDLINNDVVKDRSTKAGNMTANDEETRDSGGDHCHNKGTDHHGNDYETSAPPQAARRTPTLVTSIPDQKMNCTGNSILVMPNQQAILDARIYHQPVEAANYNAPIGITPYTTANACCNRDCHCYKPCERPLMYQMPPVHSQETRGITDYFNDDNTAGCTIM